MKEDEVIATSKNGKEQFGRKKENNMKRKKNRSNKTHSENICFKDQVIKKKCQEKETKKNSRVRCCL